jgi:hypothetical protein
VSAHTTEPLLIVLQLSRQRRHAPITLSEQTEIELHESDGDVWQVDSVSFADYRAVIGQLQTLVQNASPYMEMKLSRYPEKSTTETVGKTQGRPLVFYAVLLF